VDLPHNLRLPVSHQIAITLAFSSANATVAARLSIVCTCSPIRTVAITIFAIFSIYRHALSTTATAAGELFLFGGHSSGIADNDIYVFSTRDFSTTLLQTSVETPHRLCTHVAALSSTLLLVWGVGYPLYLLNLGMSDLLMSKPTPADQSFLRSSIARVDPRHGQWSRALRSFRRYRDFGWVPISSSSVAGWVGGILMISGHST